MLADPVSNPAIKELFLREISLTNFDVTLFMPSGLKVPTAFDLIRGSSNNFEE